MSKVIKIYSSYWLQLKQNLHKRMNNKNITDFPTNIIELYT